MTGEVPITDELNLGQPLAPANIHAWLIALDASAENVIHFTSVLARDEREQADRFRFEHDRQRYLVSHGALRHILGMYLNRAPHTLMFQRAAFGKPSVAGESQLRFNLSHSGDYALCAVTRNRELGVDIEYMRPLDDAEAIARHFFSPHEQAELHRISASEKQLAFYQCWTRKEAFIKATGEGLQRPLDSFDVSLTPGAEARIVAIRGDGASLPWRLAALQPAIGYAGALVAAGDDWKLSMGRWSMG